TRSFLMLRKTNPTRNAAGRVGVPPCRPLSRCDMHQPNLTHATSVRSGPRPLRVAESACPSRGFIAGLSPLPCNAKRPAPAGRPSDARQDARQREFSAEDLTPLRL